MTHTTGLLVLDKPGGITSRAAVDRAQRWFPGTRLGHTGTLDPLATGVLVLCVGPATRLGEYVQRMSKTYESRFLLGARSDSADADGTIVPSVIVTPPSESEVDAALQRFVGAIAQVPPAFSAARVQGRRAYKLARRGEAVDLEPRTVRIYSIERRHYDFPHLDVVVHCGKGTYVRSLARDLGEQLGCGALVQTLRRTRVGPFDVRDALRLDATPAVAHARLLPLSAAVAELPRTTLDDDAVVRLRHGQAVACPTPLPDEATDLAVFDRAECFVAVARRTGAQLLPAQVMAE